MIHFLRLMKCFPCPDFQNQGKSLTQFWCVHSLNFGVYLHFKHFKSAFFKNRYYFKKYDKEFQTQFFFKLTFLVISNVQHPHDACKQIEICWTKTLRETYRGGTAWSCRKKSSSSTFILKTDPGGEKKNQATSGITGNGVYRGICTGRAMFCLIN